MYIHWKRERESVCVCVCALTGCHGRSRFCCDWFTPEFEERWGHLVDRPGLNLAGFKGKLEMEFIGRYEKKHTLPYLTLPYHVLQVIPRTYLGIFPSSKGLLRNEIELLTGKEGKRAWESIKKHRSSHLLCSLFMSLPAR